MDGTRSDMTKKIASVSPKCPMINIIGNGLASALREMAPFFEIVDAIYVILRNSLKIVDTISI